MEFVYSLPEDYQEVAISGMVIAVLDLMNEPDMVTSSGIVEQARKHCRQAQAFILGRQLTNDEETFTEIFQKGYQAFYTYGLTHSEEIHHLYQSTQQGRSLQASLTELRLHCKVSYFFSLIAHIPLMLPYRGLLIYPQVQQTSYSASFFWNDSPFHGPLQTEAREAIIVVKNMIDLLLENWHASLE